MEVTLVAFFTFTLLLCCVLHYVGLINLHLRLGVWHLKCAERAKIRYEEEKKRIIAESKNIELGGI
jgi:hypothetical protein